MTAYEKRKAALVENWNAKPTVTSILPATDKVKPTCTKYVGNFALCGEPAIYRDLCGNKIDYEFYCEHCAKIVRTWGHNLELIS